MNNQSKDAPKGFLFLIHLLKMGAQAKFHEGKNNYWVTRAFMPCWIGSSFPLLQFMHAVDGRLTSTEYEHVFLSATEPALKRLKAITGGSYRHWTINGVRLDQLEKDCESIIKGLAEGMIYRLGQRAIDDMVSGAVVNKVEYPCLAFQDSNDLWLFESPDGEWECKTAYDCAVHILAIAALGEWSAAIPKPLILPSYKD